MSLAKKCIFWAQAYVECENQEAFVQNTKLETIVLYDDGRTRRPAFGR